MKKRNRIIAGIGLGTLCLTGSIFFAGCDASKLDKSQFRVEEGYVQWSKDGETWVDIISIEDINENLNDSINERITKEVENKFEENKNQQQEEANKEQEVVNDNENNNTNQNQQPTTENSQENNNQSSLEDCVITLNYGEYKNFFVDAKESLIVNYSTSILNLPTVKSDFNAGFAGWFITNTDIEVKNGYVLYGDITLEPHFAYLPSGLYQNGDYVMSWSDIVSRFPDAFDNGTILHTSTTGGFLNMRMSVSYLTSLSGTLIVDSKIHTVGEYAFAQCTNLTKIVLPDSVYDIGIFAFNGCSNLKEIQISQSVQYLGSSLFNNCKSLKSIVIPEGVEEISYHTFSNCTNLQSIVLPTSLKLINTDIFDKCSSISRVYYVGTRAQYNNVVISSNANNVLNPDNVFYYSAKKPGQGKFWHYAEDGVTPEIW